MKKHLFYLFALAFLTISFIEVNPTLLTKTSQDESLKAAANDDIKTLYINGNDGSVSIFVTASGLMPEQVIQIKCSGEFTVSQTQLPYNASNVELVVKLRATKPVSEGEIYIVAGNTVKKYTLIGHATPLERKDISSNPVYPGGEDTEFIVGDAEGFMPSEKGYTIEFSAKTPATISYVDPFAITTTGVGFESSVKRESFVLKNSTLGWLDKIFADKAAQAQGGSGIFYPDDQFHTYRFAVAPDDRIHVYRDGVLVDQVRSKDFGLQPTFLEGEANVEENLLVNGDFEGEYEYIADDPASKILGSFEGWNIAANDRWNSEQFIEKQEIAGVSDFTNHTLRVQRYAWQNGWGAAEYSQIVDVVPGETYTFTALAKGGYSERLSQYLGSLRIQEVKGTQLLKEKKTDVTSDTWQEYSMDYTPSSTATQIRVVLYLERGDTYSENAAMDLDNVKLTGKRAAYLQKVGFTSRASEIAYFAYDPTGAYAPTETAIVLSRDTIVIDGTGATEVLSVTPLALTSDITVKAPAGFSVTPAVISAGAGATNVTVTYNSSLDKMAGQLVLSSGNNYSYVDLTGIGTPLERKDISSNPVYPGGEDTEFIVGDAEGFMPSEKGYTIEFSAKTPATISYVDPFAITTTGVGFESSVKRESFVLKNSTLGWLDKIFADKAAQSQGGSGIFYPDDQFHTYRFAVAPDDRIHVYRDGVLVDQVRSKDFGLQPTFLEGEGNVESNLLVNGDFEGEYEYIADDPASKILGSFEGWNIAANDRWNSEQFIDKQEIAGVSDFTNHTLRVQRYAWQNGWGAAEYSQIVDVVPGETYTFSVLAKGGYSTRLSQYLGSLRIQEVKGTQLLKEKKTDVTSDTWQEYSMDYTPSATATQIRVVLYLERGDTWSESAAMDLDNVKLTGKRAAYLQKVGFTSRASEIGYFAYDPTGAYAPSETAIVLSRDTIVIDGTGATEVLSVTPLALTTDITVKAPAGFSVTPAVIAASAGATNVTVTYNSSLDKMAGQLVLNSGNNYSYVDLTGIGTPLERKDISSNPVYPGGEDTEFLVGDAEGFTPSDKGYTIEFSAKTPATISYVDPFAITTTGVGFASSVKKESFVLKNSTLGWLDKIFADKAAQAHGGSGVFYPDDKFHTYRFAVAPDDRIHVYRDGVLVDQVRSKDFGLQPTFLEGEGNVESNLLVNGDFEGEYEYIADDPASKILGSFEGWNIAANDRWNSEQFIEKQEIAGVSDFTNHTLRVQRYAWQNGWGAAEYSQIVDVVPGETYTFTALAKGGYSERLSQYLGSLRIQEVKGTQLLKEKKTDVTSDTWQEYSMDYTPSATATQIRVVLYLERGDTYSENAAMDLDNVKLTGKRAAYLQKVGFTSRAAEIGYFAYDLAGAFAPTETAIVLSRDTIVIDGTGATEVLSVTPLALTSDITVKAPAGFSVTPAVIAAGSGATNVTVTYNSSLDKMAGQLVLSSGNNYSYVDLTGIGTPLERKDISSNPVYPGGEDTEFIVGDAEGFMPSEKGYTIEFSAKTPATISFVDPFAITTTGVGFESSVKRESFVLKNSTLGWLDKIFADKAAQAQGGSGIFYPDDQFHTYRFAVASDDRIHVYRDGVLVDQVRSKDYGLQPTFLEGEGDVQANLLVNGDFEGEYEYIADDPDSKILGSFEGWNIAANDRWNSEQFIEKQEIAGVSDFTNHTLRVQRYAWQNGWGAAEYSQIVDVVPGETYTFTALAKGGYSERLSQYLGSLRIQEVKGTQLLKEKKTDVTSDTWQEYSMDYTPSSTATQIRVVLYLERGDTYSENAAMDLDNVKLTGKRAAYLQKVGFTSRAAEIGYFAYDLAGAYAPTEAGIDVEITGVENGLSNESEIFAYLNSGLLFLKNVPEKSEVSIYSASGTIVKKLNNYTGEGIQLSQRGLYIALVRNGNKSHSVKVIY